MKIPSPQDTIQIELKARNTEINISSDHTLECPHRFLQEKGPCKTKDCIP